MRSSLAPPARKEVARCDRRPELRGDRPADEADENTVVLEFTHRRRANELRVLGVDRLQLVANLELVFTRSRRTWSEA